LKRNLFKVEPIWKRRFVPADSEQQSPFQILGQIKLNLL